MTLKEIITKFDNKEISIEKTISLLTIRYIELFNIIKYFPANKKMSIESSKRIKIPKGLNEEEIKEWIEKILTETEIDEYELSDEEQEPDTEFHECEITLLELFSEYTNDVCLSHSFMIALTRKLIAEEKKLAINSDEKNTEEIKRLEGSLKILNKKLQKQKKDFSVCAETEIKKIATQEEKEKFAEWVHGILNDE